MPLRSNVAVFRLAAARSGGSGNRSTALVAGSTRTMAFRPPSVIHGAPSGPTITPCGAERSPARARATWRVSPVAGLSQPSEPLAWAVYQTPPSTAGATSCGPDPRGTGNSLISSPAGAAAGCVGGAASATAAQAVAATAASTRVSTRRLGGWAVSLGVTAALLSGWVVWRSAFAGLEQPLAERVLHQLGAVMQVQLVHHPLAVGVHRLRAEHQPVGDLLGGVPLGGELQHLALPLGEGLVAVDFLPGPDLAQILFEQHLLGRRVQEDLATVHGANRLQQVGVGLALADVTRSARLHDRQQVLLLGVHRQDQDAGAGLELADALRRFEAAHAGHGDIHDHHVRPEAGGLLD